MQIAFSGVACIEVLRFSVQVKSRVVKMCSSAKPLTLSCSRGSETLFRVADFADYVAASDDGRYIAGLSNRGSVNAFWIRKSSGEMIE